MGPRETREGSQIFWFLRGDQIGYMVRHYIQGEPLEESGRDLCLQHERIKKRDRNKGGMSLRRLGSSRSRCGKSTEI